MNLDKKEKTNIKHFYYDVIGAYYADIKLHPQKDMKELGFHWIKSEPCPIADCWWFRCDEYPEIIPDYISIIHDGFKFSDER